ncbi:ATP-binding protein [Pseudobacillus badius]
MIATAILDRLLHHSRVFSLNGSSYRMRHKGSDKGPKLYHFNPAILYKNIGS